MQDTRQSEAHTVNLKFNTGLGPVNLPFMQMYPTKQIFNTNVLTLI